MASAKGSRKAVDLPAHSASVKRSRSRPSRSKIWLRRYKGRWSAYLLTSTWASRPGPGRPRSIGREGSGAWAKRSPPGQASRGRTMWPHDAVHEEPARHILELFGHVLAQVPQRSPAAGAAVALGGELGLLARDVVRIGRRLGLCFSTSGSRSLAVIAAEAISLVSRTSWSPRTHRTGGRGGRPTDAGASRSGSPAPSPRPQAAPRRLAGPQGRGAEIQLPPAWRPPVRPASGRESCSLGSRSYPALSGRQLRCSARQSIPSKSTASCAGVRATLPSLGPRARRSSPSPGA